ncbi:MAG: glycosyltransferase family 1 protein [Methanoregula sp.]
MKILYDHQIFGIQHYGGISRYFCELMDQYSRDPEINFRLALRYSQNDHLYQQPQLNQFWTQRNNFFSNSLFFARLQRKLKINALNHIFNNQQESVRQLKAQDFDVFHPTYYDPYFLNHLGEKPFVIDIHDMMQEIIPEYFPHNDPTHARKMHLIQRADAIIAVSELTKRDILKYVDFDLDPDRIHVIYRGNSFEGSGGEEMIPIALPSSYLLFVGNRSIYKNFPFFITSMAPLLKKYPELHICCTGGGQFTPDEWKLMKEIDVPLQRVHYIPLWTDGTIKYLYRNALAFVFPSLYEGFGLPVLEAFSCGCPVIASNNSSLPEVGEDAAVYFDPRDAFSFQEATERMIADTTLRNSCIQKGTERLKIFSWADSAEKTKRVYEQVM